jgi:hypothetical protein
LLAITVVNTFLRMGLIIETVALIISRSGVRKIKGKGFDNFAIGEPFVKWIVREGVEYLVAVGE